MVEFTTIAGIQAGQTLSRTTLQPGDPVNLNAPTCASPTRPLVQGHVRPRTVSRIEPEGEW
ncbi:MAG: hypothetical protein ACE37I_01765 [Rubinisphaera brasiliensis]|uniref:hypothetical protein n=1 Tax=Rubinisphaera brasiliensis TaxID=119 RepID=UPI00391CC1D5